MLTSLLIGQLLNHGTGETPNQKISTSVSGSGLSFDTAGLLRGELGIPYALDPRNTSVITSVGREDPMELRLSKVLQGDDRGGGWKLSVMNCDAELEVGVPWIGL